MNPRNQGLLAVAVGAGVLLGTAGVFLYEHYFKEKRRLILQNDVTKLGVSVSELRRELQELREAQRRPRVKRIKASNPAPTETDSDVLSVVDDDADDEFYDLSDDENLTAEAEENIDDTDLRYQEFDLMLDGNAEDKNICLAQLLQAYDGDKENPEVLWRLAKCCHAMSTIKESEGDSERTQDYLNKGLEYATKCLEFAPRSSDAHKWYAICIGARSEHQGVKDKLKDGLEFKEHVERALELKPLDSTLHHLLGRFLFEVASLTWVERKVATTLFGEVPYATYPEALEALSRAEELSEIPWKENRLLLAKTNIQLGEFTQALDWLDKAEDVESKSKEDRKAVTEIAALKKKYQHHRGLV